MANPHPLAAQEPEPKAPGTAAMDPGVLRAVFSDLIGRPPLAAEREAWAGRPLAEFLAECTGSEAFWKHWWEEQLYYLLLVDSFRPETDRILAVPGDLEAGRIHVRDALHRAALTPTFDLRNPGSDTFVTVMMEQFCGLKVDRERGELEAGKRAYDGNKVRFLGEPAASQSDLIRVCVEHVDAARHLLGREHERMLRGALERRDLVRQARKLVDDPYAFLEIVRGWLSGPVYAARLTGRYPKSNRLFVRGLFVDLMGRLPEETELESMRTALDGLADSRPLRSVLSRMLLDSGDAILPPKGSIEDATAWVRAQFERLLGRSATGDELKAFVTAFHKPECQPRTILYALVSHPEYHLS